MKDQVLYQFGHLFKRDAYGDEGIANGVQKSLDEIDIARTLAIEEIKKIQGSREFTSQGKVAAFRSLAEKIDERLTNLQKVIGGYGDQIGRLEETIKPQRHPVDDLAWQLECREIRDHINALDPVAREAFVLSAIESGNQQVMEAVLFAPSPLTCATQDMMDRMNEQRAAHQFPEETAQLKDLRRASRETSSALGSVHAALGQHGLVLDRQDLVGAAAA